MAAPAPTATPTAMAASRYRITAATGPAAFPGQEFTLSPIVDSPPPVTAARAYAIARASGPLPRASDSSGPGTATFYAYSNSAAGTIDSDGDVTLEYQSTPAWVFRFPLSHDLQNSVGGASLSGGSFPTPTGSQCSWITIVDASKRDLIEAFEFCEHWSS